MKNKLLLVLFLLTSGFLFSQQSSNSGPILISQSGGSATFPNVIKGTSLSVVESIAGNPTGPTQSTFLTYGCFSSGTCDLLDTYNGNTGTTRTITATKTYDSFKTTVSWQGGIQVAASVNFTISSGTVNPGPGPSIRVPFNGIPTGTCSALQTAVDLTTGNDYSCGPSGWVFVGPGGGNGITITTVSGLSSISGKENGTVATVIDGVSPTDCTVGGGTYLVNCQYNGSSWSQFVGSGSGASAWASITGGTNNNALVMGAGGSLTPSGGGVVSANQVNAATVPASATALSSNGSSQLVAASIQGTDSKLLSAGIVSGIGNPLCSDANGGATTTGCGTSAVTLNQIGAAVSPGSAQQSGNNGVLWYFDLTSTTPGLTVGETTGSASSGTGALLYIPMITGSTATGLEVNPASASQIALNVTNGIIEFGGSSIIEFGNSGSYSQPVLVWQGQYGYLNGLYAGGTYNTFLCWADSTVSGSSHAVSGCMDDQGYRIASGNGTTTGGGALRFAHNSVSGAFNEGGIMATGGLNGTLTLCAGSDCNGATVAPHSGNLNLNNENVYGSTTWNGSTSGSATISATATGGTLNLGSTNATITSSGVLTVASCSGCGSVSLAFPLTVSGTVNSGGIPYFNSTTQMSSSPMLTQYGVMYGGGAGAAPGVVTPPTLNGNYAVVYSVSGSAAVAPTAVFPGIPVDATNPTTLLYSDRGNLLLWTSGTALALPAVSGNIASNLPFVIKNTEGATLTITPNSGAGDLINSATSITLLNNWSGFVYQDSTSAPGHWWISRFPDFSAFGSTCTNGLTWSTTTGIGCQPSAPGSGTMTDGSGSSTAGYFVETTTTAHTYAVTTNIDDGHTTPSTITFQEPINLAGTVHGFTVPAGTAVSGAANKVVYASDSTNGYAEVNENNTGLSRVCTAGNSQCAPLASPTFTGTLTTPTLVIGSSTGVTSTSSANTQVVTCPTGGSGTQVCDASGAWIASGGFSPNRSNSSAVTASINATNIIASQSASQLQAFHWSASTTALGTSCTGASTLAFGLVYTDPNQSNNTVASITSFTGTSGTLTFTTSAQNLVSGDYITLSGFTGGNTGLNGQMVQILAAGLNTTQFEANVSGSGYSGSGATGSGLWTLVLMGSASLGPNPKTSNPNGFIGLIAESSETLNLKAGTALQYVTLYAPGAGCSTPPTYQISWEWF
jgi:hypothetical protein